VILGIKGIVVVESSGARFEINLFVGKGKSSGLVHVRGWSLD
jgi:hypothetical protein